MGYVNVVEAEDTRSLRGWWWRGLLVTAVAACAVVASPVVVQAQRIVFCDDVPPVVGFAETTYTVAEDQGTLDILVDRSDCLGQLPVEAVVNWAVTGGTATAKDYDGDAAGTFTWLVDDYTDRVIPLTIIDDTTPEPDETLVVKLTAGNDDTVVDPKKTTLTISDNDPNTSPLITRLRPADGTVVRDRTPLIAATVADTETNLKARAIRLFVDGRSRAFTYDRATDRLRRISGVLTEGRHTVRVRVLDPVGARTVREWAFRVGR